MIPEDKTGFCDETREILNGYPAFADAPNNFIVPDFFDTVLLNRVGMGRGNERSPRVWFRYVDSLFCEPGGEIDARNCKDNLEAFSVGEAWELLRFIEPLWCEYKGIDSTGYAMGAHDDLMTASELLDDDTLDI